ncbi:MAG: hypothetical protein AUH85_09460 [Chloroflexi bacterium 13_1_40CM_4_68_4]|nr:MAG: hypothetical protein AUH85_09460 [Chloroflexi bacterium 13_1_40CM_4_68_4]
MIHDLDDGDLSPSRAEFVRAISVVLAFSALIGWAAVSSTVFRGPFATPHPSANAVAVLADAHPRYTPTPFVSIEPASVAGGPGAGCVIPGGLTTTYVFVNGGPVTVVRPAPTSASTSCAALYLSWGQRPVAVPLHLDRVAR